MSPTVEQNLQWLRSKIENAAQNTERTGSDVRLIAVCKSQTLEKLKIAADCGLTDFGENYAQELLEHVPALPSGLHWHFIGHLQRNKVKVILPHVTLIHSVDSQDLALEINKRAATLGKVQPILIEINLAGEASKTGISPENAESLAVFCNSLKNISLKGLMTMPPPNENKEASRPYFRKLREIRDAWNAQEIYKTPLSELSMGMTGDFEVAIEEGATFIRIGTGIFGERKK